MRKFSSSLSSYLIGISAFVVIIGVLCGCTGKSGKKGYEPGEAYALAQLDKTIQQAETFTRQKKASIDSIKRLESMETSPRRKVELLTEISKNYRMLDSDSAISFGIKARQLSESLNSDSLWLYPTLTLVNALSTSGLFHEAIKIMDNIDVSKLSDDGKAKYWQSARMLYAYSLAYLQENNEYAENFKQKYVESDDSLLEILPHGNPLHHFIYSERLVAQRRWQEAKKQLENLMETNPMGSNLYGMSAYQLAEVYKNLGDFSHYTETLALAARSDVMGSFNEGLALPTLANQLYEQGRLEDAFRYMNFALKEANNANIRMRTVSIANNMALIDQAYKKQLDTSHHALITFLVISLWLLAVTSILIAVMVRNMRISKHREMMVIATSRKLQSYVGNFIGLCSNYAARIEKLSKLVTRKINAGQTDELLKLVGSGRFTEEDNEEFYKLIDKAVNDIFPDFIERINTLLLPDKQIPVSKEGETTLTPELRIYACVRMGVDQSARIAQILHYSVNTVYAYRNRMRNRAIDRDTFDRDVSNLGLETSGANISDS